MPDTQFLASRYTTMKGKDDERYWCDYRYYTPSLRIGRVWLSWRAIPKPRNIHALCSAIAPYSDQPGTRCLLLRPTSPQSLYQHSTATHGLGLWMVKNRKLVARVGGQTSSTDCMREHQTKIPVRRSCQPLFSIAQRAPLAKKSRLARRQKPLRIDQNRGSTIGHLLQQQKGGVDDWSSMRT